MDTNRLTAGLYWLHCLGPDGPVVMLGSYSSQFDCWKVQDADHYNRPWVYNTAGGPTIGAKFKVKRVEKVITPESPEYNDGVV